jgi:hypothetical protein
MNCRYVFLNMQRWVRRNEKERKENSLAGQVLQRLYRQGTEGIGSRLPLLCGGGGSHSPAWSLKAKPHTREPAPEGQNPSGA